MPKTANIQSKLVPPKLTNGKVMPVSGNRPSMAPIFTTVCENIQLNAPATINLGNISAVCSIIRNSRINNAAKTAKTPTVPKKPNFSANMANMESLAASGK